jgi:hypothetical protein
MSAINFANIEQIKEEWQTLPLVNIIVTEKPCEKGFENLFTS